jgi:predicted DNA-binding transcriptional regulator AlpA
MATKVDDGVQQTFDMEAAGKILGISRPTMYQLARRDMLPVPVIKVGNRMVISKRAIADLLNARKPHDETAA